MAGYFKKRSLRRRSLKGGHHIFKINGTNFTHIPITINGETFGPNMIFTDGFIFPEAELQNLNLSGCTLIGADFSKVKTLTNVSLFGATLTNANLSGCTLNNVDLDNTDLSGKANLSSCTFNNCSIEKTDFSKSNLTNATMNIPINHQNGSIQFKKTNLTGAKLLNFYCLDCNFDKAILHKCDLIGSRMSGCSFKDADLTGATLVDVNFNEDGHVRQNYYKQLSKDTCNKLINNFTNAKFIGATLTNSILTCCIFDGADFTSAVLTTCNLSNDDAVNAKFNNAILTNVNLTSAFLSGCDFTNATLNYVRFNEAILIGTKFNASNLTNTDFSLINTTDGISSANFDNSIQINVVGLKV